MEKARRSRTVLIIVIVLLLLLLAILLCRGCSGSSDTPSTSVSPTERSSAEAAPTESASAETDDLVGRWEGSSSVLGEISIIIERTAPVPDADENSQYVSGYVVFGEDSSVDPIAPLSGIANSTGDGLYEVQIWSTNLQPSDDEQDQAQPILFTGSLSTKEGEAEGRWESGEETGDWRTEHQAEVAPDSPVFDLDHSGLRFDYDVAASIHTTDQNGTVESQYTQLHLTTNIAVSTVVVLMPDGKEITLERFTDIFSPGIDFVSEFRFASNLGELPEMGQYVFSLLDPMGEVLAGIEGVDFWSGCEARAPLNVRGSVAANGISASWSSVPAFDPTDPAGFYQIEFSLETDEGKSYGSNHIQQTSHLIPFASFAPGTPGSPDGENYGVGLSQLGDGSYTLVVYVFFPATEAAGGVGHECQVMAEDEVVTVEKTGGSFEVNK